MESKIVLNDGEKVYIKNNRDNNVCIITFIQGDTDEENEYNMSTKHEEEIMENIF